VADLYQVKGDSDNNVKRLSAVLCKRPLEGVITSVNVQVRED
jgi:hypothetical protein